MTTRDSGGVAGGALAARPPDRALAARRQRTGVRNYADLERLAHAGMPRGFEMTLTGSERGPWTRTSARLGRSSVVIGAEGGPNVGHGRIPDDRITFHVALSGPPPIGNSRPPGRDCIAVRGPGSDDVRSVRGPSRWAEFAVAPDVVDETLARLGISASIYGRGATRVFRASREAVDNLRLRFADVERRVAESPADFDDASYRSGLRRELAERFVAAAAAGTEVRPRGGTAAAAHARILLACLRCLGTTRGDPVTLRDLRAAADSSTRTLTRVFDHAFDVSPARFLRLRRLGQVRAGLRRGGAGRADVTRAATRFGFFELGRFAGNYRRLFGELPSETLSARDDRRRATSRDAPSRTASERTTP